jgi:DNA-binding transcriptional LysR family regulator
LSLPDIRHQIAALTLSEELNFTRTAERLRITQPALSKQILELESRLGYTVFRRNQKQVELTEAGQVFVRGCKDSLAILEKAVRTGRSTQEESQPLVSVGHSPYVSPSMISNFLGVHLPLYPNLRLRMESMFAHDLVHRVLSSELDIALVEESLDNPLLTLVTLSTVPLHALLSADHPAAKKRTVEIEDFGTVGWMMFPKHANPQLYDKVLQAAHQANVTPVELHHYMGPQEVVQLISENFGIALMTMGVAEQVSNAEIVARPFSSRALHVTTHLVLRADQSSRLVNEFGRAFLRRVIPNAQEHDAVGQLSLKL